MRHHFCVFAAAGLALVLSACSPSAPSPADSAAPAAAAGSETPAPAITDEAGLRKAAAAALSEQRIYTPAGDNAIEHYLALRRLHADDSTLATALLELLPYALIGSEQAVGREDFPEARRLLALIEQVDPQAPALTRLRDSIVAAEAESARRIIAEAEAAKRLEQEAARAAAAEAEAARARQVEAVAAVAAPVAATAQANPPAVVPPPAPVQPKPQPTAPVVASATPQLLSAPPPRYPLVALRRKIEGSVTVEFTIQPDGSVTSPRVVSADPPGLFEEAALVAAARWRFERTPAAVTTARVVQFRLAQAGR
ncbi:energy transducer TonB [Arenimonas daejeonensis]|uniref:energy transducer TonB n=1 Tax=Arenimonas daejeonensis TaxID=370777 RepID=UPI0011BD48C6|nr:energy transducer TonB [Arenimonas daejeonensis]